MAAAAKSSAAKPKAEPKPTDEAAPEEQPQEEEAKEQTTAEEIADIRQQAEDIKTEAKYDGKLTGAILRKLEPLLYIRTPEKFIERRIKGENGAPFDMTGVRSIQVQIDRFNAVLGQQHWRTFTRFLDGGTICHGRIIVGNDLGFMGMNPSDGRLEVPLVEGTLPEILVEREGWGGWKRGKNPGDTFKSSETNALKRIFARFGPAAEIYSLDFEDDPANEQPAAPGMIQRAAVAAPTQAPQMSVEEAQMQLTGMLTEAVGTSATGHTVTPELLAKRKEAIDAMLALPNPPSAPVVFGIMAARAYDIRQLEATAQRARASTPAPPPEQADQTPPHAPEDENQAAAAPIPEEVG